MKTIVGLLVLILVIWGGVAIARQFAEDRTLTCTVTARNNLTLTLDCIDKKGTKTRFIKDIPGDLYPGCQVNTPWEACKWP